MLDSAEGVFLLSPKEDRQSNPQVPEIPVPAQLECAHGHTISKGFLLLKSVFKSQAHRVKITLKKILLEVSLE